MESPSERSVILNFGRFRIGDVLKFLSFEAFGEYHLEESAPAGDWLEQLEKAIEECKNDTFMQAVYRVCKIGCDVLKKFLKPVPISTQLFFVEFEKAISQYPEDSPIKLDVFSQYDLELIRIKIFWSFNNISSMVGDEEMPFLRVWDVIEDIRRLACSDKFNGYVSPAGEWLHCLKLAMKTTEPYETITEFCTMACNVLERKEKERRIQVKTLMDQVGKAYTEEFPSLAAINYGWRFSHVCLGLITCNIFDSFNLCRVKITENEIENIHYD